jgi:sn-glycerol 3-phosphate transport system ATP-binding protein
MNFFEAGVSADGRSAVLGEAVQVPLNGAGLAAWAGKKVVLGIRPEHLVLEDDQAGHIRLTVDHVELLGADTLVHGHFGQGNVSLIVRLPDVHRFEKQAAIGISVPPGKLHLFDPQTGKRIA